MVAEPLKHQLGSDVVYAIGASMITVHPAFDTDAFAAACLAGLEELELTPRAQHISDVLASHLPDDEATAIRILIDSLGPEAGDGDGDSWGNSAFFYWPHTRFITDRGLTNFDLAMEAQIALTKRFTSEFSIRNYLLHHPEQTMLRLHEWADDDNVHVRRLVSEGTRPRLPWAARLPGFQRDPAPVIELLEKLKDDPEEYVRRSVANNLNDIAKDHPQVVIELAERWWARGDANRRRLVRHGLRTLIKAANPEALAVLGFGPESPAEISKVTIDPNSASIGDKVRITVEVHNPATADAGALVDLRFWFVKSNGKTSAKVFKGAELQIAAGATALVRKTISLAQHSTRKHYPGTQTVEVVLNGVSHQGGTFELAATDGAI